jgi:hypothetical protein
MGPEISVCRKGDRVYLKIMGEICLQTSDELLHAVRKMMLASLKFSIPGSTVSCTFQTKAKVKLGQRGAPALPC